MNPTIHQVEDLENKLTALMVRMWDVKQFASEPMDAIIEAWHDTLRIIRNDTGEIISSLKEK